MKKKKIFVVNLAIYPFDVLVCIGTEKHDVEERLQKHGYRLTQEEKDALEMPGRGKTTTLLGNQIVIQTKENDIPVLAHEIFHAVDFMMDIIKNPLTSSNGETYAYLIEFLTREIIKNVSKKK